MDLLWFLVIGLVAGWLAGVLMRGGGLGIVRDLAVGVIGAVLGGSIFAALGITAYGLVGSLITATLSAIVLLALLRAFCRPAQPIA